MLLGEGGVSEICVYGRVGGFGILFLFWGGGGVGVSDLVVVGVGDGGRVEVLVWWLVVGHDGWEGGVEVRDGGGFGVRAAFGGDLFFGDAAVHSWAVCGGGRLPHGAVADGVGAGVEGEGDGV